MNSNPILTKFSANLMRPGSDVMMASILAIETIISEYEIHGAKALIEGQSAIDKVQVEMPAMTDDQLVEVIDDKATEEARPIYTVGYLKKSVANLKLLLEQINQPDPKTGYTLRMSLAYMATNPRNPLLGR